MTWEPEEPWELSAEMQDGLFALWLDRVVSRLRDDIEIRCLFLVCGYKDEIVEDSQ